MVNFVEIELLFRNLLAAAAPPLTSSECQEIQHYINVGEYGLALPTAADIYAEEKKLASADVLAVLERLAVAMSVEAKVRPT